MKIMKIAHSQRKSPLTFVSILNLSWFTSLYIKILHNYPWLGGVSSISGTLKECVGEPFPTSKIDHNYHK